MFVLEVVLASATPVSGTITRGSGDDVVVVALKNGGTGAGEFARVELPAGVAIVSATKLSGPVGTCPPPPSGSNAVTCIFDPPGWPPGETVVLERRTSPRMA